MRRLINILKDSATLIEEPVSYASKPNKRSLKLDNYEQ
jgi:hypothetical protein